jgi:hypothetical protein
MHRDPAAPQARSGPKAATEHLQEPASAQCATSLQAIEIASRSLQRSEHLARLMMKLRPR